MKEEQEKEFGHVIEYMKGKDMMGDVGAVTRTYRDGGLPVVVTQCLVNKMLNYVHRTKLTGHHRRKRTMARAKGRF